VLLRSGHFGSDRPIGQEGLVGDKKELRAECASPIPNLAFMLKMGIYLANSPDARRSSWNTGSQKFREENFKWNRVNSKIVWRGKRLFEVGSGDGMNRGGILLFILLFILLAASVCLTPSLSCTSFSQTQNLNCFFTQTSAHHHHGTRFVLALNPSNIVRRAWTFLRLHLILLVNLCALQHHVTQRSLFNHQAHDLIESICCGHGCVFGIRVVCRRNFHNVCGNQIDPFQATKDGTELARRPPASLGSASGRCDLKLLAEN
jgi:hypothetical protein